MNEKLTQHYHSELEFIKSESWSLTLAGIALALCVSLLLIALGFALYRNDLLLKAGGGFIAFVAVVYLIRTIVFRRMVAKLNYKYAERAMLE